MTFRPWARRVAIAMLALAVLAFLVYGTLFIPTVYSCVALFVIERNSLMRDRIDWIAVRAEADELVRGALGGRPLAAVRRRGV